MDEAFKDKSEWVLSIRKVLENPTDKRVEYLAHSIVHAIKAAEGSGFLEAKSMMQRQLDQMRWDLP